MEPETGAFNQLQLSKQRSRNNVWRPETDGISRRSAARESVMSVAESWAKSRRGSTESSRTSLDRNASTTSVTTRGQEVRRWDGIKRSTMHWEDIKRDPELWFPDGDCFVHFYARGTSRKGPSLRLHREEIEKNGLRSMLSKFSSNALMEEEEEDNSSPDEDEDGGFQSNPKTKGKDELYIPAPPLLGRDDATKFHITTRNLFACIYEQPIVGAHLGESLVLVHERLNQYRPDKERNRDDMLDYIEDQKYTDFRDCPDHAMGVMYYAEKLRDTDLWTEAFVHCVGMYDILNTAIEFPTVSRTIGALITRAHLEMTLRMEHAYADLGNFMEDSISSAFPKLPEPVTKHLERFRSFLHAFYVQQHGYWPPPSLQPGADYNLVTKSLLRSIYTDLRNLYSFLCDPKSEPNPSQAQMETYKAIYGGLCTPALIKAFDRRFKNTPLPNPLPLLPSSGTSGKVSPITAATNLAAMDLPDTQKPSSGNAFTRFLRPKQRKSTKALNTLNSLSAASNTNNPAVMESLLVQEYSRFERDWTVRGEEKIDATEARKVRWLLIYALLQTVIGVIMVPQEVAGTEDVEYPLCVQTGGTPPWRKRPKTKAVFDGMATPQLEALSNASSAAASPFLTPTTPGAQSGAITPISSAGEIPPVPQFVLSELDKLSRKSFDSARSTPTSPGPSVRSGKLHKEPKLKSSSASIRSERSTRSSFSAMLNRSLYTGDPYGNSSVSLASEAPSQATARPPSGPQRPPAVKQKSSPAHIEHELSENRARKRTSIFGKMRSRTSSVAGEGPKDHQSLVASPTSPAQSTFSDVVGNLNAEDKHGDEIITPSTSEFPQSASTVQSYQSAWDGAPRLPMIETSKGHIIPQIDTSAVAEPDRGRAIHAPHSPSAPTPTKQKVRNFSRGRSSERPKSNSNVNSPDEQPPPIPTTTKPRSAASSPTRSPDDSRAYTDPRSPPPVPADVKPAAVATRTIPPATPVTPAAPIASAVPAAPANPVVSPAPAASAAPSAPPVPITIPPVPNNATKPRSRPATPPGPEEIESQVEALPMPPPIPFSSKPSSRSSSPAPRAAPPPPLPQSRPPQEVAPVRQPPVQQTPVQQTIPAQRVSPTQRPVPVQRAMPAQQPMPTQQASPAQYHDEPRGRPAASAGDDQAPQKTVHRSRSRSMALRPAPQAKPRVPPVPATRKDRPVSNISESSDSGRAPRSGSVSPVSADEAERYSPDTSDEMLQRKTTNSEYSQAFEYQPQHHSPILARPGPSSHAVTTPGDTAHAAWGNPRNGTFHQALREHEQKRMQVPTQRRASSRESRYRRAAWAELGGGMRNEANGMPVPPPAVRQYGAPIVRDSPARGYNYNMEDGSEMDYSDDDSDGGYQGGVASYGMKKGLMG